MGAQKTKITFKVLKKRKKKKHLTRTVRNACEFANSNSILACAINQANDSARLASHAGTEYNEVYRSHNYAFVAVALTTLWRRFGVGRWKCPIVQMKKAVVCQIKRAFKVVVFQRLFVRRNEISHEAVSRLHELKRDVLISQVHLIRLHLLRRQTHVIVLRWQ